LQHAVGLKKVLFEGTITADTETTPVNVAGWIEGLLFIDITAVSGTSPTLDITVEVGPESDDLYPAHTTVSQITTTGKVPPVKLTNFGEWLRLKMVVGGTSPSFTLKAIFQGKT